MMSLLEGMGRSTARGLVASAVLGLALCASPLQARPKPFPETVAGAESVDAAPLQNINPPREISLQQAVQIAQSRNPGRVVRAETTTHNGRAVHEIRILGTDNVVRTVRVDAQSGELR